MHRYLRATGVSLAVVSALACNLLSATGTPTALSTATEAAALQSPLPSVSPSPLTPTETPVPTQPPEPSPSPAPLTPTDTPAPTSLNATGPFVVFKGQSGIWIANPDGSFPTQVSEIESQGDLRRAISPTGNRLALVIRNDQGLDL